MCVCDCRGVEAAGQWDGGKKQVRMAEVLGELEQVAPSGASVQMDEMVVLGGSRELKWKVSRERVRGSGRDVGR